jgi:transcriptional regulator with PAS, ATPase and Fis domain
MVTEEPAGSTPAALGTGKFADYCQGLRTMKSTLTKVSHHVAPHTPYRKKTAPRGTILQGGLSLPVFTSPLVVGEDLEMEVEDHPLLIVKKKPDPLEQRISRELLRHTPSLATMAPALALAASHDVTVLLTGETGTGKTFLARLIHDCSPRDQDRFLVVPCGALSSHLVESELFGHAKGAFTGADQAKEGKFAAVGRGTLLLDEIDTLALEQQAKLLRIMESGEYEPVGSNQTRMCEARIIAASNWNLSDAVARGQFRQDLFYRLDVMSFHLPALRERKQDIGPLARHMMAYFNDKFGKEVEAISPEALDCLESFAWPGNVRQLENVIQLAVMMSKGRLLLRSHLANSVQEGTEIPNGSPQRNGAGKS